MLKEMIFTIATGLQSIETLESKIDRNRYRLIKSGDRWSYKTFLPYKGKDFNWTSGQAYKGEYKPDLENDANWCFHTGTNSECKKEILAVMLYMQQEEDKENALKARKWEDAQ